MAPSFIHPPMNPTSTGGPLAAMPLRVTALAAALALAGCVSLAPVHQTPVAPVDAQFAHAGQDDTGSALPAAADIPWKQFFVDPRLQQLIQIALDNNRDLRIASLNIEKAQAAYRIQRAERLPGVGLMGSGERAPSPLTGGQASTYTVGLGITAFELDFFGRVKNLSDAALSAFLATEEAHRTAQISLVSAVANSYLTLQSLDEQLDLTRQTLATREESQKLTQLQYKNGTASALDASQADSLVHAARATLAALTRQRAAAYNALVLLLGQPMPPAADTTREAMADGTSAAGMKTSPNGNDGMMRHTHAKADGTVGQQPVAMTAPPASTASSELIALTELPAGLPSETLVRRPDIRAAEHQLRAANANIGAARAAFFPRITLTGTAGVGSTELSALFNSGTFAWTLNPQLVLPIFDGGRNRANLRVAEAEQKIAVANYEKAIQTAFKEVSDSLANREGLLDQLDAQQALVRVENERLDMANLRYKNGVSSYFDVLDAQRSAFAAQQELISVRMAQRQNLVELYKVLGGGWQ
ncbi:MAG: efflux transporter outer membrane subunit [Lautropia sp.]|nr:efflux transporter outer membrane subunit [Lautropia sp.]